VPAERRGSTIAYIFLGWSLAAAVGLPLITFIASRYGWQAAYGGIGALGCVSFLLLLVRLPGGLKGTPVGLEDLGRGRPQQDDSAAACDHHAANVGAVRGVHLHGPAA
jgi:predicted MFS family arabinose efflux permease